MTTTTQTQAQAVGEKKDERKLVRQGDVLFTPSAQKYDESEWANNQTIKDGVLVHGSATGHHHRIAQEDLDLGKARAYKTWQSITLEAKEEIRITHEEHRTVRLAPGVWVVTQAREFDYLQRVGRLVLD